MIWLIAGIIFVLLLVWSEKKSGVWKSWVVIYDDEDNNLEDWILIDDLEEELEDEGYFDDEE